jgi:hypothetical protein
VTDGQQRDPRFREWLGMRRGSSQKATRNNQSRLYAEGKSRRITFTSTDVYIERGVATGTVRIIEA